MPQLHYNQIPLLWLGQDTVTVAVLHVLQGLRSVQL
jgi:hypothetical protein